MKIDDSWYAKPPGIPESLSAGGVIVRVEAGLLLVALVREGDQPDYILPKGRVEPGEDAQTAAQREIAEEAGLEGLIYLGELGIRERMDFRKRSWKKTRYYLFTTRQKTGRPTDQSHTYHCDWFPIDRLPSMFWPEQQGLIETNKEQISRLALGFRG
jgi:8-oxo-dGTP pyrophosphatase MutT (NUDIX family)